MAFQVGNDFTQDLARAVGLNPDAHPVRRIVIDSEVNGNVMVYVQKYLQTTDPLHEAVRSGQPLIEPDHVRVVACAGLFVDDKGGVTFTPEGNSP